MTASKNPAQRKGNPRTQRKLKPVPAPPDDPTIPASLGVTGRRYWTDLAEMGRDFYTDTDRVALLDYCKLRDLEAELEALVEAEGMTVFGSQGQKVANPNFRALLDVRKEVRAAGKDLALNPRDRVNLGMQVRAGVDLLDQLRAQSNASVSS